MTRKDIIDAWARIRKIDSTIPDEVLDFMKKASLEKLEEFNKVVFLVYDSGDPSVGINPANTKISIETDLVVDQETINDVFKPSIAEMLDVPVKRVLTKEEFEADQKALSDWEKIMDESEEAFRKQIENHEDEIANREDPNLSFY